MASVAMPSAVSSASDDALSADICRTTNSNPCSAIVWNHYYRISLGRVILKRIPSAGGKYQERELERIGTTKRCYLLTRGPSPVQYACGLRELDVVSLGAEEKRRKRGTVRARFLTGGRESYGSSIGGAATGRPRGFFLQPWRLRVRLGEER